MGSSADDGGLGGVSLAEWEYAWRYADHLALGELDGRWHAYKRRLNRRRAR